MDFEPLLKFGVERGASAIHLQAGATPRLRIDGMIRGVEGKPLEAEGLRAFIAAIAPKGMAEEAERTGASFSTTVAGARFRASACGQVGGPGLVLRPIPATVPGLDELNLPRAVREVAAAGRGLVLVVGPAQSGRTTTLAAMVDLINASSYQKVATVESPVEYLHAPKKGLVTQMEVGRDAPSFDRGVAQALRQDADVVVVGELRDAATARLVLGAAEAGRKVLAAGPGLFAVQAIVRLIALFPTEERETATAQLAGALEGVVAQRLAHTRDGKLRPVVEVLRGGAQTARAIQSNRLNDLTYTIEGRQGGMQSLDQHLVELHEAGVLSGTETLRLARDPEAVGVRLRSLREAESRPAAAASGLIDADPDLLP
jgi:twitching motility protein PilT